MKSWVFKWTYGVQPLAYGLEVLMVSQLEGVFIKCSETDLIPGIPSASIANKGSPPRKKKSLKIQRTEC